MGEEAEFVREKQFALLVEMIDKVSDKIGDKVFSSDNALLVKGRHQQKMKVLIQALPELAKAPTPQFGHLGPFFPADKNDVLRV